MLPGRRTALPLCIFSVLSAPALAVGLGEIELQSFLGAPLQAVIPLRELGDLSADQLRITLAGQRDYEAMGVEFSYLHTQLRIEPVIGADGRAFVRIDTRDPVAEPYLNFVLTLRWPNGQLNREYTVLLDPPPQPAAPAVAQRPAVVDAAPRAEPARRDPEPAPRADGRYVTRRGDSLWRLAERLRPPAVPLEQMMNALHARNPGAFVNNDPRQLKEAVAIAMPSEADIAAAARAPALSPAEPAAKAAAAPAAPAAEPAVEGGRLELLAEADVGALSAENSALRTEVAGLTSQVAGLNQSLALSEQRLRQVEARLEEVLAQYDRQRQADPAAAARTVAAGSPFADGGSPAATAAAVAATPAVPAEPPPAAGVPWWVHLGYWLAIAALAGWLFFLRLRARREPREMMLAERELEQAALGLPLAGAQRAAADERRHQPPRDGDELPLDLIVAAAEPPARITEPHDYDAPPLDPAINAGVFLAFGRFDEAEQVLLAALDEEPERTDLQLQLLDVYAQADNRTAFERLAGELELNHGEPELLAELETLRASFRAH